MPVSTSPSVIFLTEPSNRNLRIRKEVTDILTSPPPPHKEGKCVTQLRTGMREGVGGKKDEAETVTTELTVVHISPKA